MQPSKSLTYGHLAVLCDEIAPILIGRALTGCYAIGGKRIAFAFSGEKFLFFCFEFPFVRFHLIEQLPAPITSTDFSEVMEAALKGLTLAKMELLNEDRILSLTFSSGFRFIFEGFSKKANGYLLDAADVILAAFRPAASVMYELPLHTPQNAPVDKLTSRAVEKLFAQLEEKADQLKRQHELQALIRRKHKQALHALEKCKSDLAQAKLWKQTQHEAVMLQSNLYRVRKGMAKVVIADWEQEGREIELALDPLQEPVKQIEQRMRASRKGKAAIPHLEEQLKKRQDAIAGLEADLQSLDDTTFSILEKKYVKVPAEKVAAAVLRRALPYHEFTSASGLKIWVGRSAKANDLLTFQHAKGNDWWLHVRDWPGSHVVIRVNKGQDPDEATLQEAMKLAVEYSKAKGQGVVDVAITQCKFVKRFGKGHPGKVLLSKFNTKPVDAASRGTV